MGMAITETKGVFTQAVFRWAQSNSGPECGAFGQHEHNNCTQVHYKTDLDRPEKVVSVQLHLNSGALCL